MLVSAKKVSIVVPVYNSGSSLSRTIEACINQDYPRDQLEIIIVDDGSTDNSAEVVRKYPVKYIFQENRGPAKARNRGWKNAQGEIICFTDADCIPPKNWVSSLVSEYTSETVSGVGGSYAIHDPENLLAACIQEEIITRHLRIPRETNYLGSFNLSLRKRILEKVGGFDESFKMATSEDRELSYRIINCGGRLIFNPDIKVAHSHPTNILRYLRQQFWRIFWEAGVYLRYPMMPARDRYILPTEYLQPFLFLGIILLFVFGLIFSFLWKLSLILVLSVFILQFPLVASIIRRTGKTKYAVLFPVNFLRGFAWAGGGISGLVIYLFGGKKSDERKTIQEKRCG